MENNLNKIASILARFNYTLKDYRIDKGQSLLKLAIDFYKSNGGIIQDIDTISAIRGYIDCRYRQMISDAIIWHDCPVLFDGDEISFSFCEESVSGIVNVSPKRIALTMIEPYEGLYEESRIQASMPQIYTLEMKDGSPANCEGTACAQRMLELLYFNDPSD